MVLCYCNFVGPNGGICRGDLTVSAGFCDKHRIVKQIGAPAHLVSPTPADCKVTLPFFQIFFKQNSSSLHCMKVELRAL